jgi:hypothetical protein
MATLGTEAQQMERRYLLGGLLGVLGYTGCRQDREGESAAPQVVDKSGEAEIAYAIEFQRGGEALHVNEDWQFHSGDRFRLLFRPAFGAYIYVVNRGPRQDAYQVLYPSEKISAQNPIPSGKEVKLPDSDTTWLHMDNEQGDENLILVASTVPLPEFDGLPPSVARDEFESRLASVERKHRPSSSRRFEDKDWVKLFAARGKEDLAIVLRLPLLHM